MGVFGNLFGGKTNATKSEEKRIQWIPLEQRDQLDLIVEKSRIRPQLIFKHSTTCGISRMVLGMFSENYVLSEQTADLYILDLHAHRSISNAVEAQFQVIHQSPQLLIIKNGEVLAYASHGGITEIELSSYL